MRRIAASHIVVPHVQLRQVTTGTVCGTGAYTALSWDTADEDPFGMCPVPGTTVTIQVPGLYQCDGDVAVPASASSFRLFAALQFNSVQWRGTSVLTITSGAPTTGVSRVMRFVKGDTVKLAAFQDSGGNKTSSAGTENAPYFNVTWVGE